MVPMPSSGPEIQAAEANIARNAAARRLMNGIRNRARPTVRMNRASVDRTWLRTSVRPAPSVPRVDAVVVVVTATEAVNVRLESMEDFGTVSQTGVTSSRTLAKAGRIEPVTLQPA